MTVKMEQTQTQDGATGRFLGIWVVLVLGSVCFSTWADEYRRVPSPVDYRNMPLVPPRERGACRDFEKTLNEYLRLNKSLLCEPPASAGSVVTPKWERIDHLTRLDLLRKLDRHLFFDGEGVRTPKRNFDEESWQATVRRSTEQGRIELALATLDMNGDGSAELVLRYRNRPPCKSGSEPSLRMSSGVYHFVVNKTMDKFEEFRGPGLGGELVFYRERPYLVWVTMSGSARVAERLDPFVNQSPECQATFDGAACAQKGSGLSFYTVCQFERIADQPRR